jgi:(S)-sulfolactate dehydrogenase
MRIAAFDPYVDLDDPAWSGIARLDLPELLARSDAISIHVPLTPETGNLIDADAIAAMRPGAVVVNTARGGIVDEAALAAGLRDGHLGGAALDVFETEPVTVDSGRHLAGVPNLMLTPHIGGITDESNARVSDLTASNVRRALNR